MATELERIAKLETMIAATNDDLAHLYADVHGPPWDRSVRGRLHDLETDKTAAKAAEAALIAAREIRGRAWTTRQKVIALVLSVIAIASPWAMVAFLGVKPH